jgi:hypothetical protein
MLRRNITNGKSIAHPDASGQGHAKWTRRCDVHRCRPHRQQHPGGTMTGAENHAAAPGGKKGINLALQGGGAHGAFTWGVLDPLL